MRTLIAGLVVLAALATAIAAFRVARWKDDTRALVSHLHALTRPSPGSFDVAELPPLPEPVRRYFSLAIPDGAAMPRTARLVQEGDFLVRPAKDGWGPFSAVQDIAAARPGFVWDARISMMPGVAVRVRDAFVEGSGQMKAALLGAFPVMAVEGTADISSAALLRYLAEGVWMPTALLPGAGVEWTAVDDTTARATLRDGSLAVQLDFRFGPDGLVQGIETDARMRDVKGRGVPTPWRGRFSDYRRFGEFLIPAAGEVEWIIDGQAMPYWRGRIVSAEYTHQRPEIETKRAAR